MYSNRFLSLHPRTTPTLRVFRGTFDAGYYRWLITERPRQRMTEYSRHDIPLGALTARDVSQVLREAVFGRRTMTKIGSQSWEQVYACHFEVDIEGWRITIYNDCDELDYCERCVSPDGQRWDFDPGAGQIRLLCYRHGSIRVTVWPTHPSAHRPARTRTGGKQSLARRYTH